MMEQKVCMQSMFKILVTVLIYSQTKALCPCYNGGTCISGNPAYCVCTPGFTGPQCTGDAIVSLQYKVATDSYFQLTEAENYMKTAHAITQDHIAKTYSLAKNAYYLACIGISVVEEMDDQFYSIKYQDLLPLTREMAVSISYVISILDVVGCQSYKAIYNCTKSNKQCDYLMDTTEDNLVKMTNLYLGSAYGEGDFITIDERPDNPILSLTVVKTTGRDAPFHYISQYGSFSLPYWETLQTRIAYDHIAVNVLSYKSNPYKYSTNSTVDIASSVVKIIITNERGYEVHLYDQEDQLTTTMDLSKVLSATSDWIDMRNNGMEWKFVAYANSSVEAIVVDVKLQSRYDCTMYGLFDMNGYPSALNHDIKIVTRGVSKVVSHSPLTLPVYYKDSELQFTIYNTEFYRGEILSPLLMTVSCTDDDFSRSSQIHQFRVLELKSYYRHNSDWSNSNRAKIHSVEGKNVVIKSSFFGTFAANSLLLPPSTIDFEKIFENFLERLEAAPHVLVVIVGVFMITVPLTIVLRRADRKDHLRWQYLPLADSQEGDSYVYFLSVYTAVRSSPFVTSSCYFNLKGKSSATEDRVLSSDGRQNFTRGSCCNFLLTTRQQLGKLQKLTIWHDNKGKHPHWLLSKVVIEDGQTKEKYIFLCGEWLSFSSEHCKTWTELSPLTQDHVNGSLMFNESSRRGIFDDHLWFSLTMRPNTSKFTRVQRLWCIVALLYLSMVTSAMWFNSNPSLSVEETNQMKAVTLGPFTFSYRMLYVGLCSSLITFVPSFVIVFIFNNRKYKRKNQTEISLYSQPSSEDRKCLLPWWTVGIAYCLIVSSILAGGTFTFFYSLEFGTGTTNDWLMSFAFGTIQSIFLLEPCKVFILSLGLSICCSTSIQRLGYTEIVSYHRDDRKSTDLEMENRDIVHEKMDVFPCPKTKETKEIKERARRQLLDFHLMQFLRSWLLAACHVAILAIICNHNNITDSFWQNQHLKTALNSSFKANMTDDIHVWLETYFVPAMWPKYTVNGSANTAYEQRFLIDEYHYRVSLTQIRQVRRMDNCTEYFPSFMNPVDTLCSSEYYYSHETTDDFCKGWKPATNSCFDANEIIDVSFRFQSSKILKTLPYMGDFATYGGGGYIIDIGPKQSLATAYLLQLKSLTWIDIYTRAVFIDSFLYNANTRIFTNVKVVFEISEFGSIVMKTNTYSINMFPYLTPWDYCVLACQVVVIVIAIIRLVFFVVNIVKLRQQSFTYCATWLRLMEIVLSFTAVVCYILRIDQTLKGITKVSNYLESHVSFEFAMLYDQLYQYTLAGVMFIVSFDLLKPLTINSHFHILYFSLANGRKEILSFVLLFTIVITAFASYMHITTGYLVHQFRSPFSAILSMMQIVLSMISLKKHPEISSLHAQISISVFAFIMVFIFVNFFIAMLSFYFSDGKENFLTSSKFLKELNGHLWFRIHHMCSEVWRTIACLTPTLSAVNPPFSQIEKKSSEEILQEIVNDISLCKNNIAELQRELGNLHLRTPMDGLTTQWPDRIECRFYSFWDEELKFVLMVPSIAGYIMSDLICYECDVRLFADCLPSDHLPLLSTIYELQLTKLSSPQGKYSLQMPINSCKTYQYVLCSFDNGKHWEICIPEIGTSFQWKFEALPSQFAVIE